MIRFKNVYYTKRREIDLDLDLHGGDEAGLPPDVKGVWPARFLSGRVRT